jgi:hypothetical protein
MNRTSRVTERKILALYFEDHSRDETAEMVGVPPSTVSEVISILPENIHYLRELPVEVKQQDLSVFDAKKGTELRARLNDLGVKFEKLQSYVESSEKMRTNPDYEPKKVVQAAIRLSDLEEETGQSYPEITRDFESKKGRVRKLTTIEKERKQRIDQLDAEVNQKLRANKVKEHEIDFIVQLRKSFQTEIP